MAIASLFALACLFQLLLVSFPPSTVLSSASVIFPPSCTRIECPKFEVVDKAADYEIRRYKTTAWTSTSRIDDISLVSATMTGFLELFDYIQGKNDYGQVIEMTAPVITQVFPSDGPFCASSFVVSFFLPVANQPNPPPAQGLHLQKWGVRYAAVRQFGGFVEDYDVAVQAAALQASLQGSVWESAVEKGRRSGNQTTMYTVAQYNSPFEFDNRVNEIWMMFDMEGAAAYAI